MLLELELSFSGNDQETLCALEDECRRKTSDKESFTCLAKFCKNDGEILEAEQQNVREFSSLARVPPLIRHLKQQTSPA